MFLIFLFLSFSRNFGTKIEHKNQLFCEHSRTVILKVIPSPALSAIPKNLLKSAEPQILPTEAHVAKQRPENLYFNSDLIFNMILMHIQVKSLL